MRIAVCMKTVVDSQARIELGSDGSLRTASLRYEVNEYDLYAVEEAIRLAEASDGHVTLLSVGGEGVVQGLRKGLAMGADSAVRIDCGTDEVDAAGTAALLAAAIHQHGGDPQLVLAGVESADLGSSQVGVLLAEELGMASATLVVETSAPVDSAIQVRCELEGGNYTISRVGLPAVLTIQSGINDPRYPSLKGIMAAKRKELTTASPADLGHTELPMPRVELLGLFVPPLREQARMIEGTAQEAAVELVRILREEEKVL